MKLYGKLAWVWDLSPRMKEYETEAAFVHKMIKKHGKTKGSDLLDIGCGSGVHHKFWNHYGITGVDGSKQMIRFAKERNPDVEYIQGQMQSFNLGRRFDTVTALDCVAYNRTLRDLGKTIKNCYEHLKRGGVFIFTVDEVKETFVQNQTNICRRSKGSTKVVWMENSFDPNKDDTQYELTLVFLIRRKGELKVEVDKHRLGLFPLNDIVGILEEVGFRVHLYDSDCSGRKYEKNGPAFVCEKNK